MSVPNIILYIYFFLSVYNFSLWRECKSCPPLRQQLFNCGTCHYRIRILIKNLIELSTTEFVRQVVKILYKVFEVMLSAFTYFKKSFYSGLLRKFLLIEHFYVLLEWMLIVTLSDRNNMIFTRSFTAA